MLGRCLLLALLVSALSLVEPQCLQLGGTLENLIAQGLKANSQLGLKVWNPKGTEHPNCLSPWLPPTFLSRLLSDPLLKV